MPEGEEKESEIGSLFEKIMKRIPNLVKEIDTQIQETQRSLEQSGCKEAYSETHHN